VFPKIGQFHAPDDYREALRIAAHSVGARLTWYRSKCLPAAA